MDFWSKSADFAVFPDFQKKIDVSPLDPLSGLRTNQQFSSFKLKNNHKNHKICRFWTNSTDLQILTLNLTKVCQNLQTFGQNLQILTEICNLWILQSWSLGLPSSKVFQTRDQWNSHTAAWLPKGSPPNVPSPKTHPHHDTPHSPTTTFKHPTPPLHYEPPHPHYDPPHPTPTLCISWPTPPHPQNILGTTSLCISWGPSLSLPFGRQIL